MTPSKEIDRARVGLSKSLMGSLDDLFSRSEWNGDCREWMGARNDRGYGQIVVDGQVVYVHRLMWMIGNGDIPDGMYVCHTCDNPPCFRPAHLFLGTNSDNQRDALAKGRRPIGEQHHAAKLTADDVASIRSAVASGANQRELGAIYGVTQSVISRVASGESWGHVA